MSKVTGKRLEIEDVLLISPTKFGDRRGYFLETYSLARLSRAWHRRCVRPGQSILFSDGRNDPRPAFPASARTRKPSLSGCCRARYTTWRSICGVGSPTYGRWCGALLTADGGEQMFVPRGFAHGFCTLEPDTDGRLQGRRLSTAPECDSGLHLERPGARRSTGRSIPPTRCCPTRTASFSRFADFASPFTIKVARHESMSKRILVTGGAGFIGSAVARDIIRDDAAQVLVVDKLTYAGNLDNRSRPWHGTTRATLRASRHRRHAARCARSCESFRPDVVMHLAAESHVDRSIDGPGEFIQTNVVGTFTLLQAALELLARADRRRSATLSASITSRPTRCSARSATDGFFYRDDALPAELALFGLQGGVRPSRARLAPHLRPAGRDHQLLEQLRALSFPREADPADDPQRARRQAAAGLRQGRERARLALRRGSRARPSDDRGARAGSARPTTSAGDSEKTNLEVGRDDLRARSTSLRRTAASARASG